MIDNIEKLESSYYVVENELPVSVISDNKNGCVALAFLSIKEGEEFIATSFPVERAKTIKFHAVNDAFEFMVFCAKNGLAGIELYHKENFISYSFLSSNHDLGSTFPTILMVNGNSNDFILQTRFKKYFQKNLNNLSEWKNYAILDKTSSKFAKKLPFNNWKNSGLFYEIIKDDCIIKLFKVDCLRNYGPIDGSTPFFTSIDLAISFLNEQDYISNSLLSGPFDNSFSNTAKSLNNGYKLLEINDINKRLLELNKGFANFGFVINPNGTRDTQAYGRFQNNLEDNNIIGVSGLWKINEMNTIQFMESIGNFKGNNTFYFDFGPSFKLNQLNRSFSFETSNEKYSDYSNGEIEELINETLTKIDFDLYTDNYTNYLTRPDDIFNSYILNIFDVISGDEATLYFASILDVFSFLMNHEYHEDNSSRINGIHTPFSTGLIGSKKEMQENAISDLILESLKQNLRIILNQGYNPKIALNIIRLFNNYCKTIQINLLGFVEDILWQTEDDENLEILSLLEIEEDDYLNHKLNLELFVDLSGEEIAIKLIGLDLWNKLEKRSRHFIASSISQLNIIGLSPQLDYSLISIGFVKAVEYEFGILTKSFIDKEVDLIEEDFQKKYPIDLILFRIKFETNSKPPTLGNYPFVLDPQKKSTSKVYELMYNFFKNLVNGNYWTSPDFYTITLNKITSKYRNGGAHDSSISYDTCIECMNCIVGTGNNDGLIAKIAQEKDNFNT